MEVATDAAKDHNFYEKSQIKQEMANILRSKVELLESKRKLEKQYEDEDRKFEENLQKMVEDRKFLQNKEEFLQSKAEFLQGKIEISKRDKQEIELQIEKERRKGIDFLLEFFKDKLEKSEDKLEKIERKKEEARLGIINAKAELNKARAISCIQEIEESVEKLQLKDSKYEAIQPQVVQNENKDNISECLIFQPVMFTGQDSTEVQQEEFHNMLFSHTVSEQASFTVHEEDFSVPLLLEPI